MQQYVSFFFFLSAQKEDTAKQRGHKYFGKKYLQTAQFMRNNIQDVQETQQQNRQPSLGLN